MSNEPYDFIQDYLYYNSGNMAPKRYHRWTAIAVLAMALGRRVYLDYGYFRIHTDHFICLVGRMGIRKTTAKDEGRKLLLAAFENYPIGASVTTREKIVDRLSNDDDTLRTFTDETGASVIWHPMAFFINELKNFLSVNPSGMVEFLTDIYGSKYFASDTIKHGLQPVVNPCINILACETPKWITEKLKLNIIAGGFSRRMLYVYELERPDRITFPEIPPGGMEVWERCKQHLIMLTDQAGPFTWDCHDTKEKFDAWFKGLKTPDDEILEGFYEAKDVLVIKLAMCLAMARSNPQKVLTWDLIELAIAFLFTVEENLPKLTIAAGRNELAIPTQTLVDMLDHKFGGLITEKAWHREALKNMTDHEYQSVRKSLKETDQIFEMYNPKLGTMVISPLRRAEMINKGEWKENGKV